MPPTATAEKGQPRRATRASARRSRMR
jgi:hypothetical protein